MENTINDDWESFLENSKFGNLTLDNMDGTDDKLEKVKQKNKLNRHQNLKNFLNVVIFIYQRKQK